jgi:hypothetical protein
MAYSAEIGRDFWYEFDRATKYSVPFMQVAQNAGAFRVQLAYHDARTSAQYPAAIVATYTPRREPWRQLADMQTTVIRDRLGTSWDDIRLAFEDFGQGVLTDAHPERAQNNDRIHTMDVQSDDDPPIGYHRWHASIRVIQLLGIGDHAWWERLDALVSLSWAIQSFARPRQQSTPNPTLPSGDLQRLRDTWLALTPERRDRQYDLTGAMGYHPDPMQPVP